MAYCYQMKMPCEFAAIEGYCRSSACQKVYSVTYEAYTMTPMTNGDRIRAMSDEELSAFLGDWADRHRAWMCDGQGECLVWLKQPANNETNGTVL